MRLMLTTFVSSVSEQDTQGKGDPSDSGHILLSYSNSSGAYEGVKHSYSRLYALLCVGTGEITTGARALFMSLKTQETYVLSLNSNWKRLLVILAPLCPENTNILSRHTATGKLQQDGGISPLWATCSRGTAQPGPHRPGAALSYTWK